MCMMAIVRYTLFYVFTQFMSLNQIPLSRSFFLFSYFLEVKMTLAVLIRVISSISHHRSHKLTSVNDAVTLNM